MSGGRKRRTLSGPGGLASISLSGVTFVVGGNMPIAIPLQLNDLAWDLGAGARSLCVFAYRCTNADYATWVYAATVAV